MYSEVKDSGKREAFGTGAVRDTAEGKGRFDLLPAYALTRLAQHFENGARKYADENWRKGIPLRRFLDSALRHAFKYLEGQRDEDHAAAAVWNFMGLIETEEMIRRGILPASLNTLPDWTGTNRQPKVVDLDECGTIDGLTPLESFREKLVPMPDGSVKVYVDGLLDRWQSASESQPTEPVAEPKDYDGDWDFSHADVFKRRGQTFFYRLRDKRVTLVYYDGSAIEEPHYTRFDWLKQEIDSGNLTPVYGGVA